MCLVTHALQQVQALARARHDDRGVLAREPDLLEPLGQATYGHVLDTEFIERVARGRRLGGPAVHDNQPRRVGEPAPTLLCPWCGGAVPQSVQFSRLLTFFQISPEPAGYHLVDRGDVALPVKLADAEPAVFRLAREPVLEYDHRGHHVRALQV